MLWSPKWTGDEELYAGKTFTITISSITPSCSLSPSTPPPPSPHLPPTRSLKAQFQCQNTTCVIWWWWWWWWWWHWQMSSTCAVYCPMSSWWLPAAFVSCSRSKATLLTDCWLAFWCSAILLLLYYLLHIIQFFPAFSSFFFFFAKIF